MSVFLAECSRYRIKFLKLKYVMPKSAFLSNSFLGEYGENIFYWIGYADDLLPAFDDRDNLKEMLHILKSVFKRFRLAMNAGKTKTMI